MPTTRFRILHLMLLTMLVAVFWVVLLRENEWSRAAYVTAAIVALLHSLLAAIFTRGERQAFSLGYVVGNVFFGISIYAGVLTLPYLLTAKLYEFLSANLSPVPDDDHYWTVMIVTWMLATAITSGIAGRSFYRRTRAERDATPFETPENSRA